MSDTWGDDTAGAGTPKTAELPEIKLFAKWNCDDVQVSDMSLQVNSKPNPSQYKTPFSCNKAKVLTMLNVDPHFVFKTSLGFLLNIALEYH